MTALLIGMALVGAIGSAVMSERAPRASRLAKMLASTSVIAVLVADTETWGRYATWILVALVCAWVGDLALSYEGRRPFIVGLGAFAAAHIAYVVAFAVRAPLDAAWLAAGAALMTGVGVAILRWLQPHRPPDLARPLMIYVAIIGTMVAMAFASHGAEPDPRIPVAAVLFAASDILVARQRFVAPSITNRIVGLPMYFVAQLLFALST